MQEGSLLSMWPVGPLTVLPDHGIITPLITVTALDTKYVTVRYQSWYRDQGRYRP